MSQINSVGERQIPNDSMQIACHSNGMKCELVAICSCRQNVQRKMNCNYRIDVTHPALSLHEATKVVIVRLTWQLSFYTFAVVLPWNDWCFSWQTNVLKMFTRPLCAVVQRQTDNERFEQTMNWDSERKCRIPYHFIVTINNWRRICNWFIMICLCCVHRASLDWVAASQWYCVLYTMR